MIKKEPASVAVYTAPGTPPLVAIVEHHRHGVTLELVGERAPGSCPLLLHY